MGRRIPDLQVDLATVVFPDLKKYEGKADCITDNFIADVRSDLVRKGTLR